MAVRAKIDPVESFIDLAVRDDLSRPAQQKAIAQMARAGLAEAQQINARALGRRPRYEQFVDGRKGASLESVNPERGTIVFEFEIVIDALREIMRMLIERSPVRSGEYVRGHRLFADGAEVPATGVIPPADEYVITNLVPYARKLEIGRTQSGRAFVIQVKPRIYESVASAARQRFGNMFKIKFGFRSPLLPYGGAASRRGGVERATRAPAIMISGR